MRQCKMILMIFPVLSVILFNQPTQAYAWFFNLGWGGHHDRDAGYSEVVIGDSRYYYNQGVFYTGGPGAYVVVAQAPVGAVVDAIPAGFEQVEIDGVVYYRYHDVYYRHAGNRFQVIERPHEHGDEHWRGGGEQREREHGDEHHRE
jgi:hypothetical protein